MIPYETLDLFLSALKAGETLTTAAGRAGLDPDQVRKMLDEGKRESASRQKPRKAFEWKVSFYREVMLMQGYARASIETAIRARLSALPEDGDQ